VLRLQQSLSDEFVEELNGQFGDILAGGRIAKSSALPNEEKDETYLLPRLLVPFDRLHFGRLRQLIDAINDYDAPDMARPEPALRQDNICQLDAS
jgi:hypothetical protein